MLTENKKYYTTTINNNSTLIANLKNRDHSSLLQIYEKYSSSIYSYIYRIVGEAKLSEKVLEETFERVVNEVQSFNEKRDDLFIWLLNISRTQAIDAVISSHTNRVSLAAQMVCMRGFSVQKFIQLLNPIEKTIFVLMYYRNFKCEQISDLLKISVELIKSKLHTAHQKLQSEYPPRYIESRKASIQGLVA